MRKKQQLKVEEIITLFGDKHQIVADYAKHLKQTLSIKAVEKWRERRTIPFTQLMSLKEIATAKGFTFNIEDYIKKVG